MKHIKFVLLVLSVVCFTASEAQNSYFSKFKSAKKWSVGLQISPTSMNGDADDLAIGLSGGLHVKYSLSSIFGLKVSGNLGQLKGGRADLSVSGNGNGTVDVGDFGNQANSDGDSYEMVNNFKDLDISTVYTLGNLSFLRPLRKIQMFVFVGVGAIWSDVEGSFTDPADAKAYYKSWGGDYFAGGVLDINKNPTTNVADVDNAISTYKGRNLTLPFGLGIKRTFGNWLDLGLEYKVRWTRSDQLDAFSFPDARNRNTDLYSTLGLQASIKLGAKGEKQHYDWLNPVETLYAELDTIKTTIEALSQDSDNDGVSNLFDTEAETEAGVNVYGDGSVVDSDGDGIPDHKDLERFSVIDPNVTYDESGKAIDTDGDGVPNGIDVDNNTEAGVLVDVNGKEIEIGGDNACCNCDNVTLPTIVFDNNSSKISPSSFGILYAVAEKMKACPGLTIAATGYTVSKSGEQLAWKRSNAIIDHLEVNYGIERSRVTTGYDTGSGVEYSTRRIDLNQAK
jgi:outer membrane protein OmpA-like peptidoglycan-associated protein